MKKLMSVILAAVMIAAMAVGVGIFASAQIKGDVNGDEEVNNKDVVTLFRYVSSGEKAEDETVYDFNGDGEINNKDVVELFRTVSSVDKPTTSEETEPEETEPETTGPEATEPDETEESAETKDPAESETAQSKYKILLYANGEGGSSDNTTEKYTGKNLQETKMTTKKGMDNKKVTIFGEERDLSYVQTVHDAVYDESSDCYISDHGTVLIGEKTGRITTFANRPDNKKSDFTPPVNAHSSRQDFIDYASAVLLEYTGVSTEGCDVEIETSSLKTKYKYTEDDLKKDFINFIDEDPSFSAEYRITFRRKLSEVYRADYLAVIIRSDGEIIFVYSRICDVVFEPFKDVEIDAKSIIDDVEEKIDKAVADEVISHRIILTAIPDGNILWVMADVKYKYEDNGETFGSVIQYITKVAEISGEPETTEPETTEPEATEPEVTEPEVTESVETEPEETGEQTGKKTKYVFKPYGNGEGNSGEASDHPEIDLFKSEITEKEGIENKKVTIFGQKREMSYVDTVGYRFYDERSDCYHSTYGLVDIGENSGKITGFTNKPEKNESDFTPPINANSTRQEFIDYAKAVILEYTGVSVEDCDVVITTYKISTKYQYTAEDLADDFINFIDKDPDFSAVYNITFRRKLSGVYRKDQISADIRSDGEVVDLQCHLSDEKYAPFLETELDAEALRQSAEDAFDEQCISHKITLYAIPDGGNLWVLAEVDYKYEEDGEISENWLKYITKVAEIPAEPETTEPEETEPEETVDTVEPVETWEAYDTVSE